MDFGSSFSPCSSTNSGRTDSGASSSSCSTSCDLLSRDLAIFYLDSHTNEGESGFFDTTCTRTTSSLTTLSPSGSPTSGDSNCSEIECDHFRNPTFIWQQALKTSLQNDRCVFKSYSESQTHWHLKSST